MIKDILPAKSLTNYRAMQRLIGLYSTVQCAVDLIASMVCHLDWFIIWASEKLAHASQFYLLHINSDEIKSIKKLFLN